MSVARSIGVLAVTGAAIGIAPEARSQTTHYVNGGCGDDSWTGLSPVCAAPDGPRRTIQAALTGAADDDTVLVADGVYSGQGNRSLFFSGKRLVLRAQNGPGACVIDPLGQGHAFFFVDELTPVTAIDGFTIRNGNGSPGGALFFHHRNDATIRNCIITGNTSTQGGAAHIETDAAPTFLDCSFVGNTAWYGGAMSISEASSPSIINCVFAGNTASREGGALFISDGAAPTVVNATITGNTGAERAGGVRLYTGSARFDNTIIWNNTAPSGAQVAVGIAGTTPATLTIGYSIVQGGQAGIPLEGPGVLNWLAGNIVHDPRFVDAGAGNFRLRPNSRAIDAGDNTRVPAGVLTDRAGDPRFVDDLGTVDTGLPGGPSGSAVVDMGALEFQGTSCTADVNEDGALDSQDFFGFIAAFFGGAPGADFNRDGRVNSQDFFDFLATFFAGC